MRAEYDTQANALAIRLVEDVHADASSHVHERSVVALADERPVDVEVLYPDLGIDEPLEAAADRYGLDLEALKAAATSALAAPNRTVTLEVALRR